MGLEPLMLMYTVYHRPVDVPDAEYVLRRWDIVRDAEPTPGPILGTAATLPGVRLLLPLGADACLTRADGDPPHVVETWF